MSVRITVIVGALILGARVSSATPRQITKHTNCTVTSLETQNGEGAPGQLFNGSTAWMNVFKAKVSATCDDGAVEFWTSQTTGTEKTMAAHLYASLTQG